MVYPYFPFRMVHNGTDDIKIKSSYNNDSVKINPSAARLLELCNGSRTLEDIVSELCDQYGSPEEEVKDMVQKFIHDFEDKGIVWLKDDRIHWYNAPAPRSIFWEITAKCNLKCRHCAVSADKKLKGELSTQEGYELLNEWRRMGVTDITFSGGEPLIRKDFLELAYAAKRLNFSLGLATNGILINPSIAQELKKLQFHIQVSLDGSNPEIYAKLRGSKKAFDQTLNGIEMLLDAGHDITIGTVINKHNVEDIPEILKLVERYGIKFFRLIPFIPYGRGHENKKLELKPQQVREVTEYLIEQRQKRSFDVIPLEFEHTFSPASPTGIDPAQPSECGGAIHYCTVTPVGEVLPCHYFEGVNADNIKEQSFSQIWRNSRFLNYFRSMRVGDIKGYCRQCNWLSVCRGGCKAANFSNRKVFHSNCHCWLVAENEKAEMPKSTS